MALQQSLLADSVVAIAVLAGLGAASGSLPSGSMAAPHVAVSVPAAAAGPCRAGTYPKCYPAATASGYACMTKAGADPKAVAGAVSWACGPGGVDCGAISGASKPPGACWDPSKPPAQQDVLVRMRPADGFVELLY